MLFPLPCLAVGAATNSVARNDSLSMFCISVREELGPLCYTGSRVSVAPGHVGLSRSAAISIGCFSPEGSQWSVGKIFVGKVMRLSTSFPHI